MIGVLREGEDVGRVLPVVTALILRDLQREGATRVWDKNGKEGEPTCDLAICNGPRHANCYFDLQHTEAKDTNKRPMRAYWKCEINGRVFVKKLNKLQN